MNPTVTVLMPVYNAEAYLKESIESILNQTFTDFEFLIINDGSTDSSEEIIKSYKDSRIVLLNNETKQKLTKPRNIGLNKANGKYIVLMDADDISLPQRLEKQVAFMEDNPEIGVCGTLIKTIGDISERILYYPSNDAELRIKMLFDSPLANPSTIIRKSILEKYQIRYSESCIYSEDYDMWVNLSMVTKMAVIPEVLLLYRIHKKQVSQQYKDIQADIADKIRKKALESIGIKPSDDELKIHLLLSKYIPISEKPLVLQTQRWLEKLFDVCSNRKDFDLSFLKQELFYKWFYICYPLTNYGFWIWNVFWKSKLSGLGNLGFKKKVKFFIKCLLRKKVAPQYSVEL